MSNVEDITKTPPSRMNIRMAVEIKKKIAKAAALSGQDLTEFAVVTLSEKATEIINRHDQMILEGSDYQFFLDSLSAPSTEPSPKSIAAAEKYRKGTRKGVRYHFAD